mgnify:CR=1 FL=1
MNLPTNMFSDKNTRRIIFLGVICVLGSCIVSQVMMQMGGGPRDQPMDLSDQVSGIGDGTAGSHATFPDGLPPFISSAGAFYPEKAVFDFGLFIGGIIFIIFGLEIFLRSNSELISSNGSIVRKICNFGALITSLVIGVSMMMITRHPFNTSLVMHIFYAMNIFYGTFIWGSFFAVSRGTLDSEIKVNILNREKGMRFKLNHLRWILVASGFISFQLMLLYIANGMAITSAFFEWTLTFTAELQVISFLPTLSRNSIEVE